MPVDRFPLCLPFTLAQECPYPNDWGNPKNFSNDRHDPGGATMCGIIQREYDLWRKGHSQPTQPVIKISQDEGYAIYRISYWQPHCDLLGPGLDLSYFDTCVNMGATEATKVLQAALGIGNDGIWGPQTAAAVTLANTRLTGAVNAFTNRRLTVYREMRGFQYFGTDWTRRTEEIGAEALKMVGGADA